MSMCEGNIYCEIYRNKKYCHRTEAASEYRECIGCRHAKRRCEVGLATMPAADVAPVVHGRWAHLGGDEWCCSACRFVITTEGSWDKPTKKYCEDCGAKMDGGADHEDRQD